MYIMTQYTVKIKLDPNKHIDGYTISDPAVIRRRALCRAIKVRGHVPLIRRLNVLYIYNKNKHPKNAMIFRRDMKFVQTVYVKYKHSKKTRKLH